MVVKRLGYWLGLIGAIGLAQQRQEIDSLESRLRESRLPDTTRLSIEITLARAYLAIDPDKSRYYAREAQKLARRVRKLRRELLGWYYAAAAAYNLSRYEEAGQSLAKAESLYHKAPPDTAILIQIKSLRAALLETIRDFGAALNLYEEALALAKALRQPRLIIMALNNLAEFYINRGLYEAAYPFIRQAIDLAAQANEQEYLKNAYSLLFNYYRRQGQVDSALSAGAKMRAIALRAGIAPWIKDSYGLSLEVAIEGGRASLIDSLLSQAQRDLLPDTLTWVELLNWIGGTSHEKGQSALAKELLEKALSIAQAQGYKSLEIKILLNLANIYERQAMYPEAMRLLLQARRSCEKHQDTTLLPMVFMNLGNIYYAREEYDKALEAFSEAARYAYLAPERNFPSKIAVNLATVYAQQNDFETARQLILESRLLAEADENWSAAASALLNLAWIDIRRQSLDSALADLKQAEKYTQKSQDPYMQSHVHLMRGHILHLQNRPLQAITEYEKAKSLLEPLEAYQELEEVYQRLAELYAATGNYPKAYAAASQLVSVVRRLSNEENTKALTRLEVSYQYQKEKERQEQLLREEQLRSEKARQLTAVIAISAILVLAAVSIALFILYRANRKEREINAELARRNVLIEEQKKLLEEKNEALERAQKDIAESIQYARRIQMAILPDLRTFYERMPASFVLYLPRDIVSGDFYYFYPVSPSVSILALADCTGHGVPGAFMSMIGSTLLNKLSQEEGVKDAATFLERLDEELRATLHHTSGEAQVKDGMDIGLCLIDHTRHELQFAGARRPLYVFTPEGQFIELKGTRRSIGGDKLAEIPPFENHLLPLRSGITFYLFSDGIVDQFGWEPQPTGPPIRKKFMTRRLKTLLERIRPLPPHEQKERLEEAIFDWRKDLEQVDDICVIGVHYMG